MNRPVVAITMGDAAGVGPEVVVKALADPEVYDRCRPLVVGDARRLRRAAEITGVDLEVSPVDRTRGRRLPARHRRRPRPRPASPTTCRSASCRRWRARAPTASSRPRWSSPAAGTRRCHLHRAAEQGGAARGRSRLPRPHRAARRADRHPGGVDDARRAAAAGDPRDHPHRAARRGRAHRAGPRRADHPPRPRHARERPASSTRGSRCAASTRTPARTACSATARRRRRSSPGVAAARAERHRRAGAAARPTRCSSAPGAATSTWSSRCTTTRATARSRCSASRPASTSPSACR